MATPPQSPLQYRDVFSSPSDPPEDDENYSDSSGDESPEYEMGDVRHSYSPERGAAVSPPSSIWGHKYSDNRTNSSKEAASWDRYAPPFDLEGQMHREIHGVPLRRRSSPLCKRVGGVAITLCIVVITSVFIRNKHHIIEEMSPSPNDEQFNSQNTVIEGIPSDSIQRPPMTVLEGSGGEEGSGDVDFNNSSASQDVDNGHDQQQSSVQPTSVSEGSTGDNQGQGGSNSENLPNSADVADQSTPNVAEANDQKGDTSISQGQTQNTSHVSASAISDVSNTNIVVTQGSADDLDPTHGITTTLNSTEVLDSWSDNHTAGKEVLDAWSYNVTTTTTSTTTTVSTTTTPYVPKNDAGEVDVDQWCGKCAAGPPGVNCDSRVEFLNKHYHTPVLEAKIALMEQGRCHFLTQTESAAIRPVYPCRKSPEDQGGEEGAEKFCGYCRWSFSQFDCWTRVDYMMKDYHDTELIAKQNLLKNNECVLPDNYIQQFRLDENDGVEEWCAYCSYDSHKCEAKLEMYTQTGEKSVTTVKNEILAAGHCKKQLLCDV